MLKTFTNDIGLVSFMAYPEIAGGSGPVIESITKIASDPFFSLIEITHIEDDKVREDVKKILEISNIRISFGVHPSTFINKLNINSIDIEKRESSVKILKVLIDEAYFMNAESFVFVSGPKPDDKEEFESEMKNIKLSITELCRYSSAKADEYSTKQIDMILETFDDRPFAKNRLIGPTDIAVNLAREIKKDYKNFGLLLDLSHLPILGEDYRNSLKNAAEYIKHIHIGNCILKYKNHKAYGDEHPRLCIKEGEIFTEDLAGFIETLNEIGYLSNPKNAISFEVKPLTGEDPDITIAGSKRALLKALAKVGL